MTDLSELLERVKAATWPDRELDALIQCTVNGWTIHEDTDPKSGSFAFWYGKPWESVCHNCSSWDDLTASVDAALAFAERILPLAFVTLEKFAVSDEGQNEWRAWVKLLNESDLSGDRPTVRMKQGFGKSTIPALAIIAATLTALISQEDAQ